MHFDTVRLMLCIAACDDLYLDQLDIKITFLYGRLNEDINI